MWRLVGEKARWNREGRDPDTKERVLITYMGLTTHLALIYSSVHLIITTLGGLLG